MNRDGRPERIHGCGFSRRVGSTLVEVMLACLLLTILVLAGGAYLYHSRATINIQRNKRAALESANRRMEALIASGYDEIKPSTQNYTRHYLSATGGVWRLTSNDPREVTPINGRNYSLRTTVQYVDIDGGSSSYDVLRLSVEVDYRGGREAPIVLETLRAM